MRILLLLMAFGALALLAACALAPARPASIVSASPQWQDGGFVNAQPVRGPGARQLARLWWTFLFAKPPGTVPTQPIPVQALSRAGLLAAPDNTLFRLGHSTVLFKLGGEFYLFDPVFSQRASPLQWAGPKRYSALPISIDELPPLKAVILSHDHYDHLDYASVLALAPKTAHFLAPLGVGARLRGWGIAADKVRELDWWQEVTLGPVRLVATPARHFSGRTPSDANTTLWASWVIVTDKLTLFFSGDSGYFDGFKRIGERFGPFDLALVETGAYDKLWPDVHMQPEQTLQAALDLRTRWLVPIHNGTFDLALHRWQEPLERISALAAAQGLPLATPVLGAPLQLDAPQAGPAWWRGLD